ncbi:MAG: hypothetical protein H7249_10435 [Chitinophagaceae bacterium]|nr:hypothetical protein [Oligoflexus sp.]
MNTFIIPNARTVKILLTGSLLIASGAFADASSTSQTALFPSSDGGLSADAGRAMEKQPAGSTEFQRTCPQSVGDAYDTTSDLAWNILEVGIQVHPDQKPAPKLQAYTRYTCMRPLDRP